MLEVSIKFRDEKDSMSILSLLNFPPYRDSNGYYNFKKEDITQVTNFLQKVINKVEKYKYEIYIQIIQDSLWKFEMIGVLVNDKIFMIHRVRSLVESEKPFSQFSEFDFIDQKNRRKAKLEQINSGTKLNPEDLWMKSWFMTEFNIFSDSVSIKWL